MDAIKKDNQGERDLKPPPYNAHEQPWIAENYFRDEHLTIIPPAEYNIEIIKSGTVIVIFPSKESYTFQTGDVWMRPVENHRAIPSANYNAIRISFDALYYSYCLHPLLPLRKYTAETTPRSTLTVIPAYLLECEIDRLDLHEQANDPNAPVLIRHALHQLVLKVLTLMPYEFLPVPQAIARNNYLTPTEFSYFLEANHQKRFTVAELGSIMGKSLSSFKRFFGASYRLTPMQWLIQRRLEHACFLLHLGQYSVETVAVLSGFAEVSHFVKQFKKRFCISPRVLKEQVHAGRMKKVTNGNRKLIRSQA